MQIYYKKIHPQYKFLAEAFLRACILRSEYALNLPTTRYGVIHSALML